MTTPLPDDDADFADLVDQLVELDELLRAGGTAASLGSTARDGFLEQAAPILKALQELPGLAAARPAPESPETIGRYQIRGIAGSGGFGVVYRGYDAQMRRDVAIKMPHRSRLHLAEVRTRFLLEARALSRLDHPHIVPTYEAGLDAEVPYLVCAYCAGPTLCRRLQDFGPLEPRLAADVVRQLTEAVEHSHQQGIWHRDLKPSNVLLFPAMHAPRADFPYIPRVADFGLARVLEADVSAITQSSATLGTPKYLAPEQLASRHGDVGPGTDVYGLGTILYECLTGKPPFDGDTSWDILAKIAESPPAAPRLLKPTIPRDLEIICLTCLRKDPLDRYPSAAALADDLSRFLDGRPVVAAQLPWWEQTLRWARKHRLVAGLIVGVVLLCVGLITTLLVARQVQLDANSQIAAKNTELSNKVVELSAAIERADTHQKRAKAEAQRAREFGYVSDMELAGSRWQLKKPDEVRRLLSRYTGDPDLKAVRDFSWGYLNNQITADSQVIAEGQQAYWNAAVSPEGTEMALCGDRGEVHLVDLTTFALTHQFRVNQVDASDVDYSPDGEWLAVGGVNGMVHFWNRRTRSEERTERVFEEDLEVTQVRFLPDSQILWATSGHSSEWVALDLRTGARQTRRLEGGATGCNCLGASPDRRQMAFTLEKGGVVVLDTETQNVLMRQPYDLGRARAGIYSTDGQWLAVSTEPDTVRVYDTATYQDVHVAKTTAQPLVPAISSSGRLICGNFNGAIDEWRLEDVLQAPADQPLSPRTSWQAHDWTVQLAGFVPGDDSILSAGREGSIRRWIRSTQGTSRRLAARDALIRDRLARPLAVGIGPSSVWRGTQTGCEEWDVHTGQRLRQINVGEVISEIAVTENAVFLLNEHGRIGSVPLADSDKVRWIEVDPARTESSHQMLSVTPDGRHAAAWRALKPVYGELVDLQTGTRKALPFSCGVWSTHPHHSQAVVLRELDRDGDAAVVELPSLRVLSQHNLVRGTATDAAFTPSGHSLVIARADGLVKVLDGKTLEERSQLVGMPRGLGRLAISPDERTIAVAHERGPVTLWHLPTGRRLMELPLPEEGPFPVRQALFTRDGRHLVVCFDDRSLVAFDTRH